MQIVCLVLPLPAYAIPVPFKVQILLPCHARAVRRRGVVHSLMLITEEEVRGVRFTLRLRHLLPGQYGWAVRRFPPPPEADRIVESSSIYSSPSKALADGMTEFQQLLAFEAFSGQ